MLGSVLNSGLARENEDGAWLVGFPIVALLVLLVVVQSALVPFAGKSMTTGACHQAGASEAAFRALMLH